MKKGNWKMFNLNSPCALRRCLVVDHGHLSLPPVPGVIVYNQISHEVCNVESTGRTRVENRASRLGRLWFADSPLLSRCPGAEAAADRRASLNVQGSFDVADIEDAYVNHGQPVVIL
jgi:hypothetical protein